MMDIQKINDMILERLEECEAEQKIINAVKKTSFDPFKNESDFNMLVNIISDSGNYILTNHFSNLYESKIIMIDNSDIDNPPHEEIFLESEKMFYNKRGSEMNIILEYFGIDTSEVFSESDEYSYELHKIEK